jgi:hypothetical protein
LSAHSILRTTWCDGRAVVCVCVCQADARTHTHLVHPVRVQHTQVAASLANALLSDGLQLALELQLCNTLGLGLAVDNTLGVGSLAAASSDGNTVDNEAWHR